ncbi:MAG: hypothetical protein ABS42_00555 [Bdellovibrio sp. SCN 50-8]|nr:MAG: hypothetical protein ABS42_00555 [Bdellovibrio sp. SCN 50-8]
MSHYSVLIALLVLFGSHSVRAEKHLVNLSYWNWAEEFQMSKGETVQKANSNFSALGLEYEFSSGLASQGWNLAPALLIGQATGGNATGDLVYVASYQKFVGASLKATWFWRFERRVYLEAGVLAIYRPLSWPVSDDGISGESGTAANMGLVTNLRVRLTPSLDFCQSLGVIGNRGRTLWSAGFGYRF